MTTIAILGPGDLGTSLAVLLSGRGHRTLTALEGRSDRSATLWRDAGLEVAPTVADAVGAADVVISTVPPAGARDAAAAFAAAATLAGATPVFVDANSIDAPLAREIAVIAAGCGAPFVGAAVCGAAGDLAARGQLFLSGADVEPVAAAFGDALRLVRAGDDPGRAKELKLLFAAVNKGLCALYIEAARAAARAGLLDETTAALRHAYPATMDDLERMVPSYARHAGRRVTELAALVDLERALGVEPDMAGAALRSVRRIADEMHDNPTPGGAGRWTSHALIERLAAG